MVSISTCEHFVPEGLEYIVLTLLQTCEGKLWGCKCLCHLPLSRGELGRNSTNFYSVQRLFRSVRRIVNPCVPVLCLHTLVSHPFSLLHGLWPGTKRHEISLYNMFDILSVKPKRQRPGEVVGVDDIVDAGHYAARFVHTNRLGEGRGVRQRWNFGSKACRRLASLGSCVGWQRLATGRGRRALLTGRFR